MRQCGYLDSVSVHPQGLVEHPFWKAKLPVLPLPPEPSLEAFIKQHKLAPAHGDDIAASQVSLSAATVTQNDSNDGMASVMLASLLLTARTNTLQPLLPAAVTPAPEHRGWANCAVEDSWASRDTVSIMCGCVAWPDPVLLLQAVRSLRESVDLSRLSRIALSNLEKDDGVTDYTAAQPATAGGDITIDSADAELDFEEIQEQGEYKACVTCISVANDQARSQASVKQCSTASG